MSTFVEDDGAVAGRHRVVVFPRQGELIDRPTVASRPIIPPRYSSIETSGLECEVRPEKNEVPIELHMD